MILGVPTLNRYDLLGRLIASAEAGRRKPSTYLVVDNGGRFYEEAPKMLGVAMALARDIPIVVLTPKENLGVAASWNAMLSWAGPFSIAIANDDIELGADALEALDGALGSHDFVIAEGGPNANGWCLFAQGRRCEDLVGLYDENFYPAYYEDSDYEHRLLQVGIVPHREPATLRHEGWATMKADPSISAGQQKSGEYFQKKWGGMPNGLLLKEPTCFSASSTQTGWKRYGPEPSGTMRWDIINHVAETIEAHRYLEVGVCGGENMGHVCGIAHSMTKWGVDPEPRMEGVKACDVFVLRSSDEFFSANHGGFDVVFIDGLHYADQAYRDIMNAARYARVVVVHDSNPSTEAMQIVPPVQSEWTGDVWKAIARIRAEGTHAVRTVDTDYGVAVVVANAGDGSGDGVSGLPRTTWQDLQASRQQLLGLVSVSEWKSWFEETLQCV